MQNGDQKVIEQREKFFWEHRKPILIATGAIILAVIIFFVGRAIYLNINNATVTVLVAPKNAKTLIGGKRYKNGKHHIKPGSYDVNITRDGFENYSSSFSVEKGEHYDLYVCMDNNDGVDYYSNDAEYAHLCDVANEFNYDKETSEKYSDKIFSITPFHSFDLGFNIDAQLEESGEITVYIQVLSCKPARAEGLKKNALEWLQKAGVNPDDYNIVYKENSC